jgi:CBS domain-containing protein
MNGYSYCVPPTVGEKEERAMTQLFLRILSPVDFHENSLAALEYAAQFARQSDATIYLLTYSGRIEGQISQKREGSWTANKNLLALLLLRYEESPTPVRANGEGVCRVRQLWPPVILRRYPMALQQFCQRPVMTMSPAQTILDACQLLREHNLGCLVVVEEDEQLCGMLTDRDIALKVAGGQKDPQQTRVRDSMTGNPACLPADKSLPELTALRHARQVRRVPIVDDGGRVMGVVTLDDLVVLLSKEMADLSQGVAATLFGKPREAAHEAATASLSWLLYYL